MAQSTPPAPRIGGMLDHYLRAPEGIRYWLGVEKKQNTEIVTVTALTWGEAWYRGGDVPRAEALVEQPASFDPLQTAIDEGHAAGMKVYASFDVSDMWNRSGWPKSPSHVVNAHADWLMVDRAGKMFPAPGSDPKRVYLDPGNPAARKWVHDVVLDVVRRYRIDGVVLEGLRYPAPVMGFSDEDLAQFRAMLEPTVTREQKDALALLPERDAWTRMFPVKWGQWRRDNVTGLLRRIYEDVKATKPNLTIAAYVNVQGRVADWPESRAYNTFSQDWFGWMKSGIVDAVIPSAHYAHKDEYEDWARAARSLQTNTQVWDRKWSDRIWKLVEQKSTESQRKEIRGIDDDQR